MKFPILTIKNLKELNPKKISKMLKKYKALIVRGYISKNKLIKIKASFEKKFNQKIYCFDDYTEIGDMILYNGQTIHGLKDVDPHKHLDMKKIRGRLTAAVTLFKY